MPANRILETMLDRLFASMVSGPNLNCRPHASRQRVDLFTLDKLQDLAPAQVLTQLLGPAGRVIVKGQNKAPTRIAAPESPGTAGISNGFSSYRARQKIDPNALDPQARAWYAQQTLLDKLRLLAEDARTYEQDTGTHVLNVGFPLLSLPPSTFSGSRRVLAPLAFIPVSLTVKTTISPSVELACCGANAELLVPNVALLAWLEHQTGRDLGELLEDEEGRQPWQELRHLIHAVAKLVELDVPSLFAHESMPELALVEAPRGAEADQVRGFVGAAVLGLFPQSNQALLRDTQEMIRQEKLEGPVEPFVDVNVKLETPPVTTDAAASPSSEQPAAPAVRRHRNVAEGRLIATADPCQARAVRLARASKGLVIHGPPGTGKSQTITNIIGDHLARGQRVLFVCEKRTALDVVANRLEHLGLGNLCAVIHDAQSDRRSLYQALRTRLEELQDLRTEPEAARDLQRLDGELQKIHDALTEYSQAVSQSDDGPYSLQKLIAIWLQLRDAPAISVDAKKATPVPLEDWLRERSSVNDVLVRAESIQWWQNPWTSCVGLTLEEFLSRSVPELRAMMASLVNAAMEADAARAPGLLPFENDVDLDLQCQRRAVAADRLHAAAGVVGVDLIQRWSKESPARLREVQKQFEAMATHIKILSQEPLDTEFTLVLGAGTAPPLGQINQHLAALDQYLAIAKLWHGFLHFKVRGAARALLTKFGLSLSADDAQRLRTFFIGLRARVVISALHSQLSGTATSALQPDSILQPFVRDYALLLELLLAAHEVPGLVKLLPEVTADADKAAELQAGLRQSQARASAIQTLDAAMRGSQFFSSTWLTVANQRLRAGKSAGDDLSRLQETLNSLEGVLRVQLALREMPEPIAVLVAAVIREEFTASTAIGAIEKRIVEYAIGQRVRSLPALQKHDALLLNQYFYRYREIENHRPVLVRAMILHQWVTKQKDRLLVSTGSRLNTAGADLKRRLTMRGDRAMRLRQVIAVGQSIEGGDPLFDLCPVWMASPEVAAQLFPRKPLFDVVIFDEASQCRLEEALPILTRGQRVVIAGDPKQLPPTRFFESAVATSQQEDMETDQDLFESQQSEVEDLLSAALNLEIEECYLDVHYRSRNADLIAFSNQHFYSSRLQAIPGHPANRTRFAPLTLRPVQGIYEDRCNEIEAREVVRIISDLLKRAEPPSIGVACFNLAQRDLIIETLDEAAEKDPEFAARLGQARSRRGNGSFEGLFVRNLESVQGDERDHMIISTTYGPDPQGKFYKRFGPLGLAGGGRRLNVLVTRARHEVHLVTSIPPEVYRALPPVPPGTQAGGPWLLFAYLHYAELLARVYDRDAQVASDEERTVPAVEVAVNDTNNPSPFARELAQHLLESQAIGSTVHWGNEGFCVDVALSHPRRADDVTIGVLCDGTRYDKAEDPVEWDVFRTAVLEGQGWKLHRLWTPQFFRDPVTGTNDILAAVTRSLETPARDATEL